MLAKRVFARVSFEGRLVSLLPAVSALVILVAGVAMTLRAVPRSPDEPSRPWRERRGTRAMRPGMLTAVPLYLTEADVTALLTPADAIEAVEASFRRLAEGAVDNRPRERLPIEEGRSR